MLPIRPERLRLVSRSLASILADPPCHHATITTSRAISWAARRRMRGMQKTVARSNDDAGLPSRSIDARARIREKEQLDEQVNVNFYEQDQEGHRVKRRRLEDDEYSEELAEDEEKFDQGLEALEKDIEDFQLPKDAVDDPADGFFSKEERAAGHAALIRHLKEDGGFPHRVKLPSDAPSASTVFVEKFNQCLDEASLDPGNEKARKDLWRFYERSKIYIPGFLKLLPDAAWELMWTSQAEESESNTSRGSHLRILSEDMIKAGRKLGEDQRFGRLEGLLLEGQQEQALQEWEQAREKGDAGNPDFLEMGIRMYTYAGNMKRAEELLDVLFKLHNTWNPRAIAPVISASINTGTEEGAERGWASYQKLKAKLGDDMTMNDFDAITMDFLRNSRKEYALAVFRDMMLLGEARASQPTSVLQRVSDRFASFMNSSSSAAEATEIALGSIDYLPRKYQNKFFYAKWLKKLIGMGELDNAAQVIELMYERGVAPDAKHFNGLIGAWLRLESTAHRTRAEQLGWAMVQQRLDHVHARKVAKMPGSSGHPVSVRDDPEAGPQIPVFLERPTPSATIETWCTLLAHYVQHNKSAHIKHLRNLLPLAEFKMNSVFMNQLLYNTFNQFSHREVWRRFEVLSRTASPDVETWICLWECMKAELTQSGNIESLRNTKEERIVFPTPRQLFARMIFWFGSLKGQARSNALEDIESDTYNDIVRCFLLARDIEGAFVAMHALTRTMDVWPNGKTARMLLLQVSLMNTERGRRHRRITKPGKADMDDKMARTTQVLELVTGHRRQLLDDQMGKEFDDLNELGKAEESLRTLMQFLYTLARRQNTGVEGSIGRAAEEMQVMKFDVQKALSLWSG